MTPTQVSMQPIITAIVLGVVLLAVGLYDLLAGLHWGTHATVSIVVQDYSRRYPIIPLSVGILIGHLFWAK